MVAFCADALGEVPGVLLLIEPAVDDSSAGGLQMVETLCGPVEAGLVEGDLLVGPGDRGCPTAVGRRIPAAPTPSESDSVRPLC